MLAVGERAAEVSLWTTPHERRTIAELADGRRVLLFFYLFDFSST